ncbi:MFS general substrate transporter [Umbelopsis sp. AD052]|nr:MFS general substrate transporter [Umbelopsis sp. AD052]
MDENRSTQKHLEVEEHLEYIYHGSPSDYFNNTRMSVETYATAKEPDSESLTTIGDQTESEKDSEESVDTTIAVQPTKSELYQDSQATDDAEPYNDHGRGLPLKQFIIVYTGLSMAIFLSALDQTIVSTALPKIASEFESLYQISWVGSSYLLTSTAFQPLYGRLSDIFGRKPMLLFALTSFLIGSTLCGASTNMTMLIICRAFSGIGGGGIQSMCSIIISDIVALRQRAKYHAITGIVYALATILGPLIGGFFVDHSTWRLAFYINVPIEIITIIAIFFLLPLKSPKVSIVRKLKQIDYLGVILLVSCIVCLLFPLDRGGSEMPWNSPIIIILFTVGGVLGLSFIFVEGKIAKFPVIPGHVFKIRTVVSVYISIFFTGLLYFGEIYYLPIYLQVVNGATATGSGLRMMPLLLAQVILSWLSGLLTSKTGNYRYILMAGYFIMTIAAVLIATLDEHSSQVKQVGLLLMIGMATGCTMQNSLIAVQSAVEPKDAAVVLSVRNFWRSVGGVMGVAICGSLLNNSLHSRLPIALGPLYTDQLLTDIISNPSIIRTLEPTIQHAVINAYVESLQIIFRSWIVYAGMAFIASLGIKQYKLRNTIDKVLVLEDEKDNADVEKTNGDVEKKAAM